MSRLDFKGSVRTLISAVLLMVLFAIMTGTSSYLPAKASIGDSTTGITLAPSLLKDSQLSGRSFASGESTRIRWVSVDRSVLTGDSFALQLFDGQRYTVIKESVQDLKEAVGPAMDEGLLWKGRLKEVDGTLLMIVTKDIVQAIIEVPISTHVYVLRYAGDGSNTVYGLYDIDRAMYPSFDDDTGTLAESAAELSGNVTLAKPEKQIGTEGNSQSPNTISTITFMSVATQATINAAGSLSQVTADFGTSIAWTNVALQNSAIDAQLSYILSISTTYVETSALQDDVRRMAVCNDGYMDHVCISRDFFNADLAQFAGVYTSSPAGFSLGNGTWASGVWYDHSWLIGGDVSSHEIGHNAGCGHSRKNGNPGGGGAPSASAYNNPQGYFRTILSEDRGEPLYQGYSNPLVFYDVPGPDPGYPTGISDINTVPDTTSADCGWQFNEEAPYMAALQ